MIGDNNPFYDLETGTDPDYKCEGDLNEAAGAADACACAKGSQLGGVKAREFR
jgi:hypothetical protein